MKFNLFKTKRKEQEEYVKLKKVADESNEYVFEALRDFELFGNKINKGDISGKIIIGSKTNLTSFEGKNWVSPNTCAKFTNGCKIENVYLHSRNGKIEVTDSKIKNTLLYFEKCGYEKPEILINDSDINGSKFCIIASILGRVDKIFISASTVNNCNFYTENDKVQKTYHIDNIKGIKFFEIKDSIIKNTTTLFDISIISSKINDDEFAKKVYVDGVFFVRDCAIKFTTEKAYVNFPHLPYYHMGYLQKNVVLKKFSSVWVTRTNNTSIVGTWDENVRKICTRFADVEPEILESYNAFEQKEKSNAKSQNVTDSPNDKNMDEPIVNCDTSAEINSNNSQLNKNNAIKDADAERNDRLEELKKRAKELGIEL